MEKTRRKGVVNALVLIVVFTMAIPAVFRGEDLGKIAEHPLIAGDV